MGDATGARHDCDAAMLNAIDSQACLAEVLAQLVAGHPITRIDEFRLARAAAQLGAAGGRLTIQLCFGFPQPSVIACYFASRIVRRRAVASRTFDVAANAQPRTLQSERRFRLGVRIGAVGSVRRGAHFVFYDLTQSIRHGDATVLRIGEKIVCGLCADRHQKSDLLCLAVVLGHEPTKSAVITG